MKILPSITHTDDQRLERKLERCNWILRYLTLEQDSLESEASLVLIKSKYLLGHRQWERVREKAIIA